MKKMIGVVLKSIISGSFGYGFIFLRDFLGCSRTRAYLSRDVHSTASAFCDNWRSCLPQRSIECWRVNIDLQYWSTSLLLIACESLTFLELIGNYYFCSLLGMCFMIVGIYSFLLAKNKEMKIKTTNAGSESQSVEPTLESIQTKRWTPCLQAVRN